MLKFVKYFLWLLMLLHCLSGLVGEDKLVDLNANLTEINDDLWPKNVSQLVEHKSADNEDLKANEESSVKSLDTEEEGNNRKCTKIVKFVKILKENKRVQQQTGKIFF